MLEFIIISTLNRVTYGLLLFMVSAGLTLIFGMMGVLNFAHASFYMLGSYIAYSITRTIDFWIGLWLRHFWSDCWGCWWSVICCGGCTAMAMLTSCCSPLASPSSSKS